MKKIVLVALLAAAAACGGKKSGSDCDAAIAKGIENFSKSIKEHAPNPQVVDRMMGVMDKLKGVLVERCKADNWAPEVVTCFTTVNNRKDMQGCQSKLTPEQSSKLTGEIAQVMMSAGGMMGQRMPPGMPGHPAMLQGNTGSDTPAAPGAAGGSADPSAAPAAPPATPPAAPPAGAEGSAAAPGAGSPK
ncbi:MAG TPA: hypothetical protein VHW23_21390 [Kofleriaceae bacterium]|jgi:hypothetical protein|nr:hypothetical protein [Kofleriaceae bacterium]